MRQEGRAYYADPKTSKTTWRGVEPEMFAGVTKRIQLLIPGVCHSIRVQVDGLWVARVEELSLSCGSGPWLKASMSAGGISENETLNFGSL